MKSNFDDSLVSLKIIGFFIEIVALYSYMVCTKNEVCVRACACVCARARARVCVCM